MWAPSAPSATADFCNLLKFSRTPCGEHNPYLTVQLDMLTRGGVGALSSFGSRYCASRPSKFGWAPPHIHAHPHLACLALRTKAKFCIKIQVAESYAGTACTSCSNTNLHICRAYRAGAVAHRPAIALILCLWGFRTCSSCFSFVSHPVVLLASLWAVRCTPSWE